MVHIPPSQNSHVTFGVRTRMHVLSHFSIFIFLCFPLFCELFHIIVCMCRTCVLQLSHQGPNLPESGTDPCRDRLFFPLVAPGSCASCLYAPFRFACVLKMLLNHIFEIYLTSLSKNYPLTFWVTLEFTRILTRQQDTHVPTP